MSIPKTAQPRPACLAVLPDGAASGEVYAAAIRPACEAAGAYCERAETAVFDEGLLHRMHQRIAKADVVIADLSGRQPGVFYLAGYALALGKATVLLAGRADEVPRDLKALPHIVYGRDPAELRQRLETRIRLLVEHRPEHVDQTRCHVEVFVDRQNLASGRVVYEYPADRLPAPTITVRNASAIALEPGRFRVGVITPSRYRRCRNEDVTTSELPDGRFHHALPTFLPLFPEACDARQVHLDCGDAPPAVGEEEELIVRVFTRWGAWDWPLLLRRIEQPGGVEP